MSVRTLIEKIGRENLLENFNQTDKSLKEVVSGEIGANLVEQLAQKYDMDFDYFSDLMMLLSLFVSKSINTQEFVNEISAFVPPKYFPQFLQELEDKLWSPYDVYLNKAGVVYKQLTKLTPAPVVEESTSAELGIKNKELSNPAQLVQEQVQSDKQQQVAQLPPVTELPEVSQSPISSLPPITTELPKTIELPNPSVSKPAVTQGSGMAKPVVIFEVSPAGEKRPVEVPIPPVSVENSGEAKQARVKFDAPRVGPRIFKPTESSITPEISEVEFTGPEIRPEITSQVAPQSSVWQRPEEKKVEIPKPPEVKKTEVAGRQVIDLTNFGLSQPDKD